jgi:pyruvate/oxaloacetate carboxyltransferase
LFYKYIDLGKNKHLFIFDFATYKNDFNRFIKGQYSQFSLESKLAILDFFISSQEMSDHVHDFLSPEFAHSKYAIELDVDIKEIENVYEICSIPDLNKETFQNNNLKIDCLLNNNSISLEK